MNKLKIVIIDDASDAREVLRGLLDMFCEDILIIGEAHDIASAKEVILLTQPDLVFLDVDLNGEHGFDLLPHFNPPPFQVIFSTGSDSYAVDAFRVNAVDYLMKPLDPEDLMAAIEKVKKIKREGNIQANLQNIAALLPKNEEEKIIVTTTEGSHLIDVQKIMHVEGDGSYSTFFIENEEDIVASKHLKHYEKLLDSEIFVRPHQSHLVNLKFIKTISTQNNIYLKNGKQIPLSRGKKKEITDLLNARFKS